MRSTNLYVLFIRLHLITIFLLCLALALILSAKRSIKETKNALFHARSGNEPLDLHDIMILQISLQRSEYYFCFFYSDVISVSRRARSK